MKRALLALLAAGQLLTSPAHANDKLTVILDWLVNPDHAPLILAQEKGIFARYGLDVELVPPSDAATPAKLVAAGQADIAVGYQPNLILDVDQGLPLVRIGTLVETPLNSLITKADGPVKTIADLKGKKIGYSVGGFDDGLLGTMLETAGLKPSDVELVNVNFSLSPSVLSGQVDAVIGGYRNVEVLQMENAGTKARFFPVEEYGVPAYDELILEARKDKVNDPRLSRFVSAVEEAAIYLTNHPEEGWQLFIRNHKDLDDKLNKDSFALTLPVFSKSPGAYDPKRYIRFAEFLKSKGLIKEVKPVEEYAVSLK